MNMSKQSKPHSSQYCKRVLLANSKVKKKMKFLRLLKHLINHFNVSNITFPHIPNNY